MNCELAQSKMTLFVHGELSFDEEEQLESHAAGCPGCAREIALERAILELAEANRLEPTAAQLATARRKLAGAITMEQSNWRARAMARLREWLDFHPGMRIAMRPLAAVLLLGAGFAVGLQQRPHTAVGAEQRVRLVRPAQDGQVEMVIDEVIQKKLRGPVEDVAIRKLLMSAAHDPDDPALRAEVLDVLKGGSEALDVRNSLISSLEKDPSSEVRMKALEALRPYAAFPDVRRAISKTLLGDLNSEVRILAIDTLVSVDQPDVAGTLQKLLESEPNQYLRQRSQAALVAMKASTDTF